MLSDKLVVKARPKSSMNANLIFEFLIAAPAIPPTLVSVNGIMFSSDNTIFGVPTGFVAASKSNKPQPYISSTPGLPKSFAVVNNKAVISVAFMYGNASLITATAPATTGAAKLVPVTLASRASVCKFEPGAAIQ